MSDSADDKAGKLRALLIEHLGLDDEHAIGLGTKLVEDLGCDSIDVVEVLCACEEEYDLDLGGLDGVAELTFGELLLAVSK